MNEAWLDQLRVEKNLLEFTQDAGALGWHRNRDGTLAGFAYGGWFYHPDGRVTSCVSIESTSTINKWYLPAGDKQVWLRAVKLLTDRKRPELDIIIAAAFAAPLTVFAGTLYGPVLIVWGEPGTSKTTAQAVAASVWGHPRQTRESVASTSAAVQVRLGRVRNLPVYWDDVQSHNLNDLSQCLFVLAEGAQGASAHPRGGSIKERGQWQTIMVVCANVSLIGYLHRRKLGPDSISAGLRRMIEIEYTYSHDKAAPGLIDPLEASRAFAALNYNYGVIGSEYAALLARNHVRIEGLVADVMKTFTAHLGGVGASEAFWVGLATVLIAGATLARELGVELDVEAIKKRLYLAVRSARVVRYKAENGSRAHKRYRRDRLDKAILLA